MSYEIKKDLWMVVTLVASYVVIASAGYVLSEEARRSGSLYQHLAFYVSAAVIASCIVLASRIAWQRLAKPRNAARDREEQVD